MDKQNINTSGQPATSNRPRLKKIKRPVRRVAPQAPVISGSTGTPAAQKNRQQSATPFQTSGSPFAQHNIYQPAGTQNSGDIYETFNNETNISGTENLPSLANFGQQEAFSPQHPPFLGTVQPQGAGSTAPVDEGLYMNGERVSKNMIFLLVVVVFFVGFIVAKLFFAEEKIVRGGLQGVVVNAEVPKGRARCGMTDKNQGCVLYLMNPQRNELLARDFYDLASQLTGRQRFIIETGNMRYATTRIKPGQFGQFNIPPLQ